MEARIPMAEAGTSTERAIAVETDVETATGFAGIGEMRERCRTFDWTATPLGAVDDWKPSLRTALNLVLGSPVGMSLWCGPEFTLLYNDGYRSVLGSKHPGALGRPGAEVWAEIWSEIEIHFQQIRAGGPSIAAEYVLFSVTTANGGTEERWFDYALSPVHDDDGAVIAVLSIATDTSARVRMERALSAERARLAQLLEVAPAVMAVYSGPEQVISYVNPTWERIVGKPGSLGRPFREVFPEMASTGIYERLQHVYKTGEPQTELELRLPLRRHPTSDIEDTYWQFAWQPQPGPEGELGPSGKGSDILVHALDVTEHVRARHELERTNQQLQQNAVDLAAQAQALHATAAQLVEQNAGGERVRARLAAGDARYHALLEALDVGFCVIHVLFDDSGKAIDYRYLEGNRMFWEQSGLPIDMIGRRIREVAPNLEERWFEAFGRVALTGEPTRLEDHAEGLDRWFEVFAFRVDDPALRRVAVLFTDVSKARGAADDRERLLRESEVARAEAEAANRAKADFLAVMSHELRTPLNAIGGYAELIELGIHGPVTEPQRAALDRIQRSQRHLLGLIAGVLDYSRVEAGAITYRISDVPVAEGLAEAELLVAPQLRAKGLGYAWSGAPPGLSVRADREKLQQILLNLLGNAIKFTEAREGAPGRIDVSCTVEGDTANGRVRIHVRDTGEGIAEHVLERVFEPFVQADQRLTRQHAGVGLGLAISRDLARGMGGDLTVDSTLGVGSTFTVTLPRA